MPTAPKTGFTRSKQLGSAPFSGGLATYTVANAYGTALGLGDPVKITTDGTIIQATNSATTLGIAYGFFWNDTVRPRYEHYLPASTTPATGTITAYVSDDPNATYKVKAAGNCSQVKPGDLYPMNLTAPNASTGLSQMTVNNVVIKTGALAVTGTNNATLTGLANNDTFNISTSVNTTPVTITIVTNQTPAQLLALLNAVPGISAALNGSSFLVVTVTDGGSLILADGTGTPLADSTLLAVAGTYTSTVALASAMVQVIKRPTADDITDRMLEVTLVNHKYATNIA